jgi:hypothetical protein
MLLVILIAVFIGVLASLLVERREKEEPYKIPKPAFQKGSQFVYSGTQNGKVNSPELSQEYEIEVEISYGCLGMDEGNFLLREKRIERIPLEYAKIYGDAPEIRAVQSIRLSQDFEVLGVRLERVEPQAYAEEKGPVGVWLSRETEVLPVYEEYPFPELYNKSWPAGKEWKEEIDQQVPTPTSIPNYKGEQVAKLEGMENITTRAGKFNCIKLTTLRNVTVEEVEYGKTLETITLTQTTGWIDAETGILVKKQSEFRVESEESTSSFTYSAELIELK